MKAPTMLETLGSLLGAPACAIPLSVCRPAKTYLLDKAGIPATGTAILFTIPYVMTCDVFHSDRNLSLYAVPRDYHGYMKVLERTVLLPLQTSFPEFAFALFADHSPILEVDAAARAGLGILGQNGLLITPDFGSFVFIGELITDADYATVTGKPAPDFLVEPPVCQGCGACIRACPMGCRDGDRALCLSALTQKKGELTSTEEAAVRQGGLVWGCDVCQLVCPHNIRVLHDGRDTNIPYFMEDRLIRVDRHVISRMNDKTFGERAYAWRGRKVIERNCALLDEDDERSKP